MKLFCSCIGILMCSALGLIAGGAVPAGAQTRPQSPPAQGQPPPPAQGQPPQGQTPPRRVPPRAITLHVTVRDQSGTPIPDARVSVSGAATKQATTDAKGVVTLAAMRDGSYRLRFEHDGFIVFEREITIRAGQPTDIDVALNMAPVPIAPPKVEAPPPPPPPAPKPHIEAIGSPVTISIPAFLDKNFIGRDPLKESMLGCTAGAMTRLLQLRDPLAVHTHSEYDEILYVVAGEGTVHIRDDSSPISAGTLSIIPRGVAHGLERRGRNPLIVISMLAGILTTPCEGTVTSPAAKK